MIRSIEFHAMNTSVTLAAEGERAIDGMYAAKIFIEDCEQRFSRFLPYSEVSELNRASGKWAQVSDELMEMLQLSTKYHQETHGIFDPSILADLKQIGYDRSMDDIRAHGAKVDAADSARPSRPDFRQITFDPASNLVRLPFDAQIDLGGIAKGWIVKKAAELLHIYVDACAVSAGGDIQFIGQPLDGYDWDIYLEDPRDTIQMLAQMHIPAGGVATSSVMKRKWMQGEKARHHLIDPRTGQPAQTQWLSVTVISPDVIESDVYAKTILIGGEKEAERLLTLKKELTYIAVDPDGNLHGSPNYKDYLYELTADTFLSNEIAR
ncbi:MAG: FAD:protein FMN transferase [Anaerolineales bacterium]